MEQSTVRKKLVDGVDVNDGINQAKDDIYHSRINNDDMCHGPLNCVPPSDLKFDKDPKEYKQKAKNIIGLISEKCVDTATLKDLALSEGGLVNDSIRKVAWPLLLNIPVDIVPPSASEDELQQHPEYQQVVLDVNRSLKRFPPGIPLEQRLSLQNQLTRLILRVVIAHPRLRYYQGYHDVAVTLLLVVGEEKAFYLLEKLSTDHLKECMEPTMDKTSHLLNYIYPLIKQLHPKVYEHLDKSGVGTMFALPWFLTWFGHSLNHYNDVVRLYDYFLASKPLAAIYLSAVIVVHRAKEILNTPCDMASLHFLLSQIPDNLPFEKLLKKTTELYRKYPPERVHQEVEERTKKEHEQRKRETLLMKRRLNQRNSLLWRCLGQIDPIRRFPVWAVQRIPLQGWPRYRYLVATATFVVGLYAYYLRSVDAFDPSCLPIR